MGWNDELEELIPLARSSVQGARDEYRELVTRVGQVLQDNALTLSTDGRVRLEYLGSTWLKYGDLLVQLLHERGYTVETVRFGDQVALFIYAGEKR